MIREEEKLFGRSPDSRKAITINGLVTHMELGFMGECPRMPDCDDCSREQVEKRGWIVTPCPAHRYQILGPPNPMLESGN